MKFLPPVFDWQIKVSQWYGKSDIDYSKFGMIGHNGIDIACPIGTPVMTVAVGKIKKTGIEPNGFGIYIVITHLDDSETIYAHLSSVVSHEVGKEFQAGEVIANSGNTGNSTGPHLHFGYRPKNYNKSNGYGGYEDPKPYLMESLIPELAIPEPIQQPTGKARIVCDEANVRSAPGFSGLYIKSAYKGEEYQPTGNNEISGGLKWREVKFEMTGWIAEKDGFGNVILENV